MAVVLFSFLNEMVKRQLFLYGFKFVTLHVVSYLKFGLLPCMFLCRPIERDKL